MTKKKRIITRLLVVLAALTLISCCFLGTTFARYTSTNSGSASVEVAKWNVDVTNNVASGETSVSFGKLSPSADTAVNTNTTGKKLVATITNNSDVAATVTVAVPSTNGITLTTITTPAADFDEDAAKGVFTVKLYCNTTSNDAATASAIPDAGIEMAAKTDTKTETAYIYAEVIWTTTSDELDTKVGENVTNVSVNINYTATQSSQQPTT